jgi:chitinase
MKPGRLIATLAALTTFALLVPLAVAGPSQSASAPARGGEVVGYFIEWGIYGRNYKVKDVETSGSADRLTVMNYAFGNVAPDEAGNVVCKLGDEWADYQKPWAAEESVTGEEVTWPRPILGNFQQLQALKQRHPI